MSAPATALGILGGMRPLASTEFLRTIYECNLAAREHWAEIETNVVLPGEQDQQRIHELLYRIKQGEDSEEGAAEVEQLLRKHRVRALIAGCTEMHLLTKRTAAPTGGRAEVLIADPLLTIARTIRQLLGMDERVEAHGPGQSLRRAA